MSPKCAKRTAARCSRVSILVLACLGAILPNTALTATDEEPWVFVSSPDWLNRDVGDLSGDTPGVPAAPGWALGASDGVNGVSPQMLAVQAQLLSEAASRNPRAFLIAGDLVDGIWLTDAGKAMFDPAGHAAGPTIDRAAEIYYGWLRATFASQGISPVIAAIGDHELGDDPWPANSEKARQFVRFKQAFGRHMVDVLNLPPEFNGVATRPDPGPAELMSHGYRLGNVLFVSLDMFDFRGADRTLDPVHGAVVLRADVAHREWLAALLSAADADETIDHVIVQAHGPAIDPVRMRTTSGLMLRDREESALWQLLRLHDQRHGGKLRLYIAGEVHTPTVVRDPAGDLVQIVHGNPPSAVEDQLGEYSVFTVYPDRIQVEQYQFDLYADGSSQYWCPRQGSDSLATGASAASGARLVGTLELDFRDGGTAVAGTGSLTPVDFHGLPILFDFDRRTAAGRFGNAGEFGDLDYEGEEFGPVHAVSGKFGNGIALNGTDAYVASGRGSITAGGVRTVSAWVKLTAGGGNTILSYGWRKDDVNGRFNFRVRNGRLELEIGPSTVCRPATGPSVTNGQWRHVAVALTRSNNNVCSDVQFFVDGEPAGRGSGAAVINTLPWNVYRFGAGYRRRDYFFEGQLDDVAVWHVALDAARLRAMVAAADHGDLGYDTRRMERLFALHRAGVGAVAMIDGRAWHYATGLGGSLGQIVEQDEALAIRLEADGSGVVSGAEPPPPPPPPPPPDYRLLCSGNATVDGSDPACAGGTFTGDLWIYLWPETAIAEVAFHMDGALHYVDLAAPWEYDGGAPSRLSDGLHQVVADVLGDDGGRQTLAAGFDIVNDDPPPPPLPLEYVLLCSADAVVDGSDPACAGGTFAGDLWIYVWPETAVVEVAFHLDGTLHRIDRSAPWEFDGGIPSRLSEGEYLVAAEVLDESDRLLGAAASFQVVDDTPPPSEVWEAEDAFLIERVRFGSGQPGYTGSGYADFVGEGGIEWTVVVPETRTYELVFRYALGRGGRALAISVDGVMVVPSLHFPRSGPWGDWSVWDEVTTEVELEVGVRTITAMSTGRNGPNVDHLRVAGFGPPPPPPLEYVLLCSADAVVDGSDPACAGGTFAGDLWIYVWPETAVVEVAFHLDGTLHRIDRSAPWEFDGGIPSRLSEGEYLVAAEVLDESDRLLGAAASFQVVDDTPPPSEVWEAEDAFLIERVRFGSGQPGYTGSGYADFVGEGGIEWTVVVPETRTYEFVFRYALGRGGRALAISVDGVMVVPSLHFPRSGPWGDWSVWDEVTTEIDLEVGVRTITAMSTGRSGPNVDNLRLVGR